MGRAEPDEVGNAVDQHGGLAAAGFMVSLVPAAASRSGGRTAFRYRCRAERRILVSDLLPWVPLSPFIVKEQYTTFSGN